MDNGGSVGSASPENVGEPWPRAFIADLIQHRGPLCPKCGVGFDTDGDGDCAICAGKPDIINHPPHYTFGKIEVIDVIEDWGLSFHLAQVVKYVARAKHKGKELEDLRKARFYLNRLITSLEK